MVKLELEQYNKLKQGDRIEFLLERQLIAEYFPKRIFSVGILDLIFWILQFLLVYLIFLKIWITDNTLILSNALNMFKAIALISKVFIAMICIDIFLVILQSIRYLKMKKQIYSKYINKVKKDV